MGFTDPAPGLPIIWTPSEYHQRERKEVINQQLQLLAGQGMSGFQVTQDPMNLLLLRASDHSPGN